MKEIQIIPGRHECNRVMDMRITSVDAHPYWIIYGICKKCEIIVVCSLLDSVQEPKENTDFIIDYKQIAKTKEVNNEYQRMDRKRTTTKRDNKRG